jgi:hypothetical protein
MDRDAWLDQHRAVIRDAIRTTGWSIQYIGGDTCSRPGCCPEDDDQPPFGYTVGLHGMDHPELLMVGADPQTTASVINTLGERVKGGEALMPGMMLTFDDWPHRIVPEEVPNPGEILLWANSFYDRPADYSVPALQLTYDDTAGRFPWDDGYAAPELQPRPGTFTAWFTA